MAQTATLSAAIRQDTGKGAARSLRRQGKVPGVIYGHGRTAEALVVRQFLGTPRSSPRAHRRHTSLTIATASAGRS